MNEFRTPRSGFLQAATWLLRVYLAVALTGCATTRKLSVEEVRQLETRTYACSYKTVFEAGKMCLQDLGYTIRHADYVGGTITGHQEAGNELGEIHPAEDDDDLPTWAAVLIVVTGIIIIVGLIALLSSDDDDDDDKDRSRDEDDDDDDSGLALGLFDSPDVVEPGSGTTYHYEITLNLTTAGENVTTLRVSAAGAKLEDGALDEAGPVHDADFYAHFFAAMDEALRLEQAR